MSKSETNGRHDQDEDRWMQWLKNRGLSGTLQRSHLQSLREQIARVDIDGFTSTLHISDGSRLFVKCMPKGVIKRLETEVDGLLALRAVCEPIAGLRVPEVIGGQLCQLSNCAILITRYISEHRRSSTDMRQFGAALARLHHLTRGELVGWHTDNFCGATPQPNAAAAYNEGRRIAWPAFFAQHRLLFQIERLKHRGFVAGSNTDGNDFVRQCLQEKVRRIAADLPRWMETHWSRVAVHEPSVLLHGDLWSGNYLFGRSDAVGDSPVYLIDPAVYRGHREAEWGMLQLFGGVDPSFFEGYHSVWPLADGWRQRVRLYVLYHLLNHANLFGGHYIDSSLRVAEQILQ